MTNPIPTPQYGPTGAGAIPPGGYAPRGGANLGAPTQGAPASFTAPTGEGWSGRSLSEAERNTQGALLALKAEIGKAVVGQDGAITGLIVALVAGGHALLEGVPGVAKTLLVRTLARALDVEMARIQFTPDLMPADITGSMVWDAGRSEFVFREGPVFTNLLLADEINRTPPKTQSALLESMEEHTVSIDGATRVLPDPFMVIATQNPVEYEGTYPLPEAQLDRFLVKLELPLPSREAEIDIVARHQAGFNPMSPTSTPPTRPPRASRSRPPSRPTWSTCAARRAPPPPCASGSPHVAPPPCCAPRASGRSCRAEASSPPTTSRRWRP